MIVHSIHSWNQHTRTTVEQGVTCITSIDKVFRKIDCSTETLSRGTSTSILEAVVYCSDVRQFVLSNILEDIVLIISEYTFPVTSPVSSAYHGSRKLFCKLKGMNSCECRFVQTRDLCVNMYSSAFSRCTTTSGPWFYLPFVSITVTTVLHNFVAISKSHFPIAPIKFEYSKFPFQFLLYWFTAFKRTHYGKYHFFTLLKKNISTNKIICA